MIINTLCKIYKTYIKSATFPEISSIVTMSISSTYVGGGMKSKAVSLDNMKFLSSESVQMKNRSNVEDIVNKLKEGGLNKLQVIVDFDRTLTVPFVDGKESLSSFGIFNLCPQLPADYQKRNQEIYDVYRAAEIDPSIAIEEKSILMEEWLKKKSDILYFELDSEEIEKAVAKANVVLRENTDAMFQLLSSHHVPLLVFSAGLGNTIEGVLKLQNLMYPNVHVISNFLKFEGPRVCGLQGKLIHTFNKNESAIKNTEYFNELQGKENVLLLGDSLGDVGMADGVKDLRAVLKIGFLQEHVEENLAAYLENFDIVLINDDTMNVPNEILTNII